MQPIEFDRPVTIALGTPRRPRTVRTIVEAAQCLKSENWPARNKPLCRIARKALEAARTGDITPAEAREAFSDAALEAQVLVPGESTH